MPEYTYKYNVTSKNVSTLIDQIAHANYILQPEYQRDIVWSGQQKKDFIESTIDGVAIPPIIYNYDTIIC